MSHVEDGGLGRGRAAGEKRLLAAALVGVVVISAVTILGGEEYPPSLVLAISFVPYVATFVVGKWLINSGRVKSALAGGLVIYLVLDAAARYEAFFAPSSSTAGLGVLFVMIFSALIIPAGAALTYLVLRLFGRGEGSASK